MHQSHAMDWLSRNVQMQTTDGGWLSDLEFVLGGEVFLVQSLATRLA
jgi:uncharacterized protein (AIM24 family)